MNEAFGRSFQLIDDTELPAGSRPTPGEYAAWVQHKLATMQPEDRAILRFRRPWPTAAFSPQDVAHPEYERVKALARARGFEPVERGTGGRLTMFDEHALAVAFISPHPAPHRHMMQRYEILSGIIAGALSALGIAAHVGELPNEYCPGRFSINAEGRIKLVGVAQRMNSRCFQIGAIIAVEHSAKACAGIAEAYRAMALPFDPATYGAITDLQPALTYDDVRTALVAAISGLIAK